MSMSSMQIQQSPYNKYKQWYNNHLKFCRTYFSKKSSIELYNKRAVIAPHNNSKIHQELFLFFLIHCWTNSLKIHQSINNFQN